MIKAPQRHFDLHWHLKRMLRVCLLMLSQVHESLGFKYCIACYSISSFLSWFKSLRIKIEINATVCTSCSSASYRIATRALSWNQFPQCQHSHLSFRITFFLGGPPLHLVSQKSEHSAEPANLPSSLHSCLKMLTNHLKHRLPLYL